MLNPLGFIPFVHLQDSPGFKTINISPPPSPLEIGFFGKLQRFARVL